MTHRAAITAYWDAAAAHFDDEPDHGLLPGETRAAWSKRLVSWLGSDPAHVLDLGCGTGSLAELLAQAGHRVTGVDLSPRTVEQARAKLAKAGLSSRFLVGDAAKPPVGDERFDVLLSRHLVWTLPDPQAALHEWVSCLRPGGTLILVEGRWGESGQDGMPYVAGAETLPWHRGIGVDDLAAAVDPIVADWRTEFLSDEPALWGGPVTDERYALIARV